MKILISKGRKDVRSREDNRNRMESNIKIASRIIIFFNKIIYVIRYVGFRDVIISIHVEKKRKIRGGFNILLLDSGRKILNFFDIISTKKDDFQSRYGIQFLPSKETLVVTFPHVLYDTLGRLIFHALYDSLSSFSVELTYLYEINTLAASNTRI